MQQILLEVFVFKQTSVALLWWWAVEDFTTIGTLDLKKSYHHSGPSPMRPNNLWIRPDHVGARAQADSWSLSHLGSLYLGTTPVMIKLDHNMSCPWV